MTQRRSFRRNSVLNENESAKESHLPCPLVTRFLRLRSQMKMSLLRGLLKMEAPVGVALIREILKERHFTLIFRIFKFNSPWSIISSLLGSESESEILNFDFVWTRREINRLHHAILGLKWPASGCFVCPNVFSRVNYPYSYVAQVWPLESSSSGLPKRCNGDKCKKNYPHGVCKNISENKKM